MIRPLIISTTIAIALSTALAVGHAQGPQSSPRAASTTRLVRFAGVLANPAGEALTGPQTVTFTLFDQAQGGTVLWTETLTVISDDRGRFAVNLGSSTPLPQDLFNAEQARWIGTAIDGRDLGRTALVAVPYALKAADADTLGGHAASTYVRTRQDGQLETGAGLVSVPAVGGSGVAGQIAKWVDGVNLGSSVISESSTNRVGFGLTDPTGGGVVDSVFTIKNYDNNTGFGILNDSQQRRFAINTLFSGGWTIYDGGSGGWLPGLSQVSGHVGVRNAAPEVDLHVGSSGSAAVVRADAPFNAASGPRVSWAEDSTYGFEAEYRADIADRLIFRSVNFAGTVIHDDTLVLMRDSGRVGISVGSPSDMLHVGGDIRVGTGTTGCVKDADGTVIAGTCSSDARLKKNITPFGETLTKLTQLQPVHFDWRADEFPDRHFGGARSFGLVAQDVEAVIPELVVTDAQGFKAIKYSELPFYMLQAIKELKAENDAMKSANGTLKQQLQDQDERLQRLEALARR